MKKNFLIIPILAFTFADAQEFKPKTGILPIPRIHHFNSPAPIAKLSYTLPNGNKVSLMPQDNMPCIVPDMSQFNMPVVKPNIKNYNIPNPAISPPYKPRILTDEQWRRLLEKQKTLQ